MQTAAGSLVAISAFSCLGVARGDDTLFLDLATTPGVPPSSSPERFTHLNGKTYFAATDDFGTEPWVSDGTAAGTFRLGDLAVGISSSVPDHFTALGNGEVVFSASDSHGRELWITDGTPGGTHLLLDIQPGSNSSLPSSFAAFQGKAYFFADDFVHGRELWETDGTPSGTQLVADVLSTPANILSPTTQLRACGGKLYFGITKFGVGTILGTSDGTGTGTAELKLLNGDVTGSVSNLFDFNGTLLFVARHPTLGFELWRSDGTLGGTFVVRDISSTGDSNPNRLMQHGSNVFFAASNSVFGRELWQTDGTALGTHLVVDIQGGISSSDPTPLGSTANGLLFSAALTATGRELWATDGTSNGTHLVKDIWPGTLGSTPTGGALVNGTLLFGANDGVHGIELWKSDGTAGGTQFVVEIAPGFDGFEVQHITAAGPVAIFAKNDLTHGIEPYVSDGTAQGTHPIEDLFVGALTASATPEHVTAVGDRLFFTADDGLHGNELFVSDGTPAATTLVKDLNPGENATSFFGLVPFDDRLFFFASDAATGLIAPFATDSTAAGTVKLLDGASCFTSDYVMFRDKIYFTAVVGDEFVLASSDGSLVGTSFLPNVHPEVATQTFEALDDFFVFSAFDSAHGFELYRSDGTAAGTSMILDINPGPDSAFLFSATRAGDRIFFDAFTPATGTELWVTDGSPAGTHIVFDSVPGPAGTFVTSAVEYQGRLVFLTSDFSSGARLWSTDGTNNPTLLASFAANQIAMTKLLAGSAGVVFGLGIGDGSTALFRTDGTVAGTSPVPVSGPLLPGGTFEVLGTDREIVLSIDDPGSGIELFHCDGSTAIPLLVGELASGVLSSFPGDIERLGNRVFVSANDGIHGVELHVLPFELFGSYVGSPFGDGCAPLGQAAPSLTAAGSVVVNQPFSIAAAGLPANSVAVFVAGAKIGAMPFSPNCSLLVAPPFVTFPLATDALGAITLPVMLSGEWLGQRVTLQALASGGGIFATPLLELVVGP